LNRDQKRATIERLAGEMREATAMIVADYRGLTVSQVATVRNGLRETGAGFHVAKNTLTRIAAEEAGRAELVEFLTGPTAIAFARDDPAATAKRLQEAARATRMLAVRGGIMDGRTLSADEVRQLADLPPREVVLAQTVGAVSAPLQSAVSVLAAPLRELVLVLDAYIQKRQEAEGSPTPA
jgi:large subunit ribosomal protein L10